MSRKWGVVWLLTAVLAAFVVGFYLGGKSSKSVLAQSGIAKVNDLPKVRVNLTGLAANNDDAVKTHVVVRAHVKPTGGIPEQPGTKVTWRSDEGPFYIAFDPIRNNNPCEQDGKGKDKNLYASNEDKKPYEVSCVVRTDAAGLHAGFDVYTFITPFTKAKPSKITLMGFPSGHCQGCFLDEEPQQ